MVVKDLQSFDSKGFFRATEGERERERILYSFIEYIFTLQNDNSSMASLISSDLLMCFFSYVTFIPNSPELLRLVLIK